MDSFDRGEQNILDITERAIGKVKDEVFAKTKKDVSDTPIIQEVPNPATQGHARVLTMDGAPKISVPAVDERPAVNSNNSSSVPIAASANSFSDSDNRSNSGSSFVIIVLACIAFVVLAAVIGYGIAMMFK